MTLKAAIYAYLQTQAGLTALVSTRVYPQIAPASAKLPYVTYQQVSGSPDHIQTGASGLAHARVQFDAWADTPEAAEAIADQLRLALDAKSQVKFGGTNGVVVVCSVLDNEIDGIDVPSDASDQSQFRCTRDFLIDYFRS